MGWTEPAPIAGVNTPDAWEQFVVFTPDGSEMLFVRDNAAYYAVPVADLR